MAKDLKKKFHIIKAKISLNDSAKAYDCRIPGSEKMIIQN